MKQRIFDYITKLLNMKENTILKKIELLVYVLVLSILGTVFINRFSSDITDFISLIIYNGKRF